MDSLIDYEDWDISVYCINNVGISFFLTVTKDDKKIDVYLSGQKFETRISFDTLFVFS